MKIIENIKKAFGAQKSPLGKELGKTGRYIHLDSVDSTSSWLMKYKPEEGEMMTLVTADEQTAGRGQGTNHWESEPGKNLTFSLLIHPPFLSVREQFLYSEMEALAIKDVLDKYTKDITLKWPNDIYWKDYKLSGTIIDTRVSGGRVKDLVYGTGINVNQREFHSDAPNPVSLYQILGHELDLKKLLREIMESFAKYYSAMLSNDFIDIAGLYHASLYRAHGFHRYRDKNGEFEGAIVEVEDDGHLILRDKEGVIRSYAFKEVVIDYGKI